MLLALRRVGERCSLQRNEPACVVGEHKQVDLVRLPFLASMLDGGGVMFGISTFISLLITSFSIVFSSP